ncbi:hypothetical protein M3Y98_00237900 [Aphelenchoides besseyi]|nr:hypothetical protein M3Y98_00237900 [Aphelenchoides besseyi]KAI6200649.1 hypothetical protein M3Y96_00756200 [Aphelenchoides besseyi]
MPRTSIRRLIGLCLFLSIVWLFLSPYSWNTELSSQRSLANFPTIAVPHDFLLPKILTIGQDITSKEHQDSPLHAGNSSAQCNIPKLQTNNSEIAQFFTSPKPLNCGGKPLWLELDEENRLVFTDYAKQRGSNVVNTKCSVYFYDRVNDNHLKWTAVESFEVGSKAEISENFVANCTYKEETWKHLYMNLVPNQTLITKSQTTEHAKDWSGLNVFFLGFDSLSHQAFRRSLPLTVEYLEKEMETVVLNGYNIVGDGTPQAFIPILTAQTEEELPLTRKRYPQANYVDVYPFIWKNFSENGYVTGYGEDAAAIGTFTYRLKGFRRQPTDHYTRTFFQFAEKFEKNWKCSGPIPQHKIWFKYAENFMRKYPSNVAKFLLMHHSLLSHDDINDVNHADADLKDLLQRLHQDGLFDKSVVIVMADHGHRFSKLRGTQQGQLEERLPFFSIYLPPSFRKTEQGALVYKNLKANADRLSTPFDIHATLSDVLHLPSVDVLSTVQSADKRSLSLFRPIPSTRSCEQAGIAPHWCTCLSWQSALESEELQDVSKVLAHSLVQSINAYTAPERSLCSELRLSEILDSKRLVPDESLLRYSGVKDQDGFIPDLKGNASTTFGLYQIRLKTVPGYAIYDTTLFYDSNVNEVTIDYRSISHINKFGEAPHCIIDKNYFLATYCVCYDKISVL